MNPVTAQGTNIKLGNVANELLQMITSIMQQQAKPSEMKSAVLNLMQTLQPMLVQASTAAVQQNQAQVEQTSTSGTQQTLAFQASGDVFRSMVRKPLKEQTTASTAAAQTLVQIVGDGSRTTGLNALAAKALLQTPVIATVVEASSAELNVNAEQSLEAVTSQSSSEESSNQGLFRLTGTPDQAVKAEAPVIQANRFAHGMSELIKSLNIPNNGGPTAIQITLAPEHLGKVDVRMSMQNGQLVAQFVADSLHGKDLLESQLPQLRAALQAQGLQVERLEVTQSEGSAFAMFQEQRQQQSSQQFNRNQQSGKNGDDTAIDFDAELAVLEARKTALAGSSFDVSA
jgi:flagellar hook-length control protein FliK